MSSSLISVQFVGTGNAWSKPPINYNTNAIIRAHGATWLLDCGLLCPLGLADLNIPQNDIDAIFISHLHGDHVLGLEEILFTRFFAHHKKHSLWIPEKFAPGSAIEGSDIWNNCLRAAMETSIPGRDHLLTLSDYADIHTVCAGQITSILDTSCEIFEVEHAGGKPAYGIILDNRIAFTGDCTFSRQRIDNLLNRGIDTIFHEISFTPPFHGNIHSAFDELATLPRDIASHIYLMHYGDQTTLNDFERAQNLGFHIAKRGQIYNF